MFSKTIKIVDSEDDCFRPDLLVEHFPGRKEPFLEYENRVVQDRSFGALWKKRRFANDIKDEYVRRTWRQMDGTTNLG